MITDFNSFVSQAVALPLPERYELTQRLLDTFGDEIDDDADLAAEIERRCAEVDSGAVQPVPFDQAMREIRAKLDATRNSSAGPA
jgi:putative addiction module component (TIGR02574 family)